MKLKIELTDAQAALLLSSRRLSGTTLQSRLLEIVDEACGLSKMDAELDRDEALYRMFGLTPPWIMFDDEEAPF